MAIPVDDWKTPAFTLDHLGRRHPLGRRLKGRSMGNGPDGLRCVVLFWVTHGPCSRATSLPEKEDYHLTRTRVLELQ